MMEQISRLVFGNFESQNMLTMDWDHLIVLDACRLDVFQKVYKEFFTNSQLKSIISPGSSTMEVVKKIFNDDTKAYLRDVIFINSNPVIDNTLGTSTLKEIFHKYIPVWKKYWNWEIGTVKPENVYKVTLKIFINHPNKRFMIWFLQPHFPYLSKKFSHINYLGRNFMNKSYMKSFNSNFKILYHIFFNLIKKGSLCAGIPESVCDYCKKHPKEILEAYISNLLVVLFYAKRLTQILPGKIVITSDHGEAFGEKIKLFGIQVYGHPSRVKILSLIQVPWLEIKNEYSIERSYQKALKEFVEVFKI